MPVWLRLKRNASTFQRFVLFFFFPLRSTFQCFLVDPVYCLQDPQISFFNKIFIKNWSHDIIYIFENYFVTEFSVFSFQQNKRYPNEPFIWKWWLTTHSLSRQSCGQKNGEINLGPCSLLIDLSSMLDGYTILWA